MYAIAHLPNDVSVLGPLKYRIEPVAMGHLETCLYTQRYAVVFQAMWSGVVTVFEAVNLLLAPRCRFLLQKNLFQIN